MENAQSVFRKREVDMWSSDLNIVCDKGRSAIREGRSTLIDTRRDTEWKSNEEGALESNTPKSECIRSRR